jgi:hypothetical protein
LRGIKKLTVYSKQSRTNPGGLVLDYLARAVSFTRD